MFYRLLRAAFAVTITLGIIACKQAPEPSAARDGPTPNNPPGSHPASTPPKAERLAPIAPIQDVEVTALLNRWLAAQNAGDFDGYSALYANRFQGIKRIGLRVQHFDRVSWLRDRKRMFSKSTMRVEALNPKLNVFPKMARVDFEQRWASASFSDRGEKTLSISREHGVLKIEREEMLTSNVASDSEPLEIDVRDFMQVERTGRTYVVLAAKAEPAWGRGEAVLDSNDEAGVNAARVAVKLGALPEALKHAAAGMALDLFGPTGRVCQARSDKLFLLRRFLTNDGFYDESFEGERPAPHEIAKTIWAAGEERTLLVAEVTGEDDVCKAALWARASESPAPTVYVQSEADAAFASRVTQAASKLRGYKRLQTAYELFVKENYDDSSAVPKRWESAHQPQPNIKVWRDADRTFASYDLSVGGCADYLGAVWGLFELRDDRLLIVADSGASTLNEDFVFKSIADIDGDGEVEVFGGTAWPGDSPAPWAARARPTKLVFLHQIGTDLHGCGC